MTARFLVDTNVLVYRYDHRFPEKQRRAEALLAEGLAQGTAVLCHQVLVEFVAATTRTRTGAPPLLRMDEARQETESLLAQFPMLYPTSADVPTALRGVALYELSWFDALVWAVAELNGIGLLYTEDFQHGRQYGRVRVRSPFAT